MDKKKSILNVTVSIAFRIMLLVGSLIVRRFLIKHIGNEANGIDSLYASIIGFLSVADLGIGSAITFCMYKPIVEGDADKVSALFGLFRKIYIIIGAIILLAGCAVMPLLPYLAKDYSAINVNLYLTFGLMLISVVLTYAFSAEISLINAYKNNYISTSINSGGLVLQYILQIVVIIITQSFIWYFVCKIIAALVQWGLTELVSRLKYKSIIRNKQRIDTDTKKEVSKNVKAMFMHKIGSALVNSADSIIISTFIGVVILGKYTNYTIIMTAMSGTLILFFTPLTSIIGHMYVKENKESICRYYNFFYTLNYLIGVIFFLGYYAVIDNIVTICFGDNLELIKSVSFVITINSFIQFMRQATLLFRDATGTFYNDRWKPLFEGLLNIALSIGFVFLFDYLWGENFAVVGVIAATILTNIFICHIVEPHVLYKHAFHSSVKRYYLKNYLLIVVFTVILVAMHFCMISNDNQWVELFANGGISLAFSLTISLLVILSNKDFRHYMKGFINKFKNRKKALTVTEPVVSAPDVESGNEEIQTTAEDE